MPQDALDAPPELVAYIRAGLITNYVICGLMALVTYEYVITIQDEIRTVWRRKWTSATILFILNRYLLITYAITAWIPSSIQSCGFIDRLAQSILLAQYLLFGMFSALRVYALWNRNIPVFMIVFGLNLVAVVTNIYNVTTMTSVTYAVYPTLGGVCFQTSSMSDSMYSRLSLATRTCVIVADILVLCLTWMKTFGTQREAFRVHMKVPIITLLIRDGTIYFIALLAMNVAQILTQAIPIFQMFSPTSVLLISLTPILISRFLLNLRQVDQSHNDSAMRNLSQFSVPGFRVCTDLVSDMGGSLEHNPPLEVNISDPNSNEGRSEIIQNATGYDSVIEELPMMMTMM